MSARSAPATLIDGVDVDAVVRAVRACRGVVELHGGFPAEVATYLPGRRVVGLRIGKGTVDVQVRAAWGVPAPQIAAEIRTAVAPLAGGRSVDVTIGALGDPPPVDDPPRTERSAAGARPGDSEPTRAGDVKGTGRRPLAMPASEPAGMPGGDPLLVDPQRHGADSTQCRIEGVAQAGSADLPKPAMPSGRPEPQLPAEPAAPLGWPPIEDHPARTRKERR